MRDVFVVGVGMTPFGKHLETRCAELGRNATKLALADAGIGVGDLDLAIYANAAQGAVEGQHGVKGQHALRPLGVEGIPVINVENACTGSSTALNLAAVQIAGGFADVALVVGAEKLNTEDREKRFAAFNQPDDLAAARAFVDRYWNDVADIVAPPSVVIDDSMRSVFMDIYSVNARLHMKRFETTWEQIAAVSAKNHKHSTMNPLSQFRHAISLEEVLAARVICWPLTLPMCAPISDGAAAAILCSRDALERFKLHKAIRVCASVLKTGTNRDISDIEKHVCRRAALEAYDKAGLKPEDISVAEVHDASAFAEIAQVEFLGLCAFGEGGPLAVSGATSLGGRIPVNVSGGLESKGHPIAATGLAQIYELVRQLRGDAGERTIPGARYAISANGGGYMGVEEAVCCVTILGQDE